MKLPKCPHCEKLMLGVIGTAYVVGDHETVEPSVIYYCPETCVAKDPDWVEVLEVS